MFVRMLMGSQWGFMVELARVVVGRSRELMHSSWVVGVREEERFI
jgi:hypothetical protein